MHRKIFLVLLIYSFSVFVFAQRRSALVISNYDYSSQSIESGKADGDSVAVLLQKLHFDVSQESNLNHQKFSTSIKNFAASESDSDALLFYYRGYAIQFEDKNYLIPVETDISSVSDITLYGLELDDVLERFQSAKAEKIFIFLDACDENPWQRIASKSKSGLASIDIPSGKEIIVMYSQGLNKNSFWWDGSNSLFTQCFLQEFKIPDIDIKKVCSNIAASVEKFSGGNQTPWINSTMVSRFIAYDSSLEQKFQDKLNYMKSLSGKAVGTNTSENTMPVQYTPSVSFRYINPKNKIHAYMIAYFGVSYKLYEEVCTWAQSAERGEKIYKFNEVLSLSDYSEASNRIDVVEVNRPVKKSTFLDALAWANAYSEYSDVQPVYYDVPENVVFRDAQKKNPSIAAYLNQNGYRFPLKAELNYVIETKMINEKYKGYLLAKGAGNLSTYNDPTVKVAKDVPTGMKFLAAGLNPVLGLGSYIEGDISGGVGFTIWQGLGLGTAYFGYYVTEHWKKVLAETGNADAKINYLAPNIIVGSGLGVYGISAVIGLIRPFTHPPIKKQKFSVPTSSGEYTDVSFDFMPGLSPSGDLAMCLTFAW